MAEAPMVISPALQWQLEEAVIAVARKPIGARDGVELAALPPHLWDRLRLKLQAEYRNAIGDPAAVLVVEGVGTAPENGDADLEARLALAAAQVVELCHKLETVEAGRNAVIALLYTDEVFVGSRWEDYPHAGKGVWPALCAHAQGYGADAEVIPPEEIMPLAALVQKFGHSAVTAWVCNRRGAEKPDKGELTPAGKEALAFLRACIQPEELSTS